MPWLRQLREKAKPAAAQEQPPCKFGRIQSNQQELNQNPRDKYPGGLVSDNQLADDDNVAGLQTLGALLDRELNALAFLQVLEPIALNG